MNIEAESASALEDVIAYYKTKGIDVNTPVKIVKTEKYPYGIMALSKKRKEQKRISQPEIMDKLFSYDVIAKFLDIKISKEKIIDNIIKNKKVSNGYEIGDVEIIYGDQLVKILDNTKEPEKHYRIILSHEIWHLIEHEKKIYNGLISEGTATYAMTVYEGSDKRINRLLEKVKAKGINDFKELLYEYCAALVKKQLKASTNLKILFNDDIRKKISTEYQKHVRIHAPKIFSSEMKTAPWMFRSYINEFFGIKNNQNFFINELEESEIYNSLVPEDKNKIIQTYGMLQERIRRKK